MSDLEFTYLIAAMIPVVAITAVVIMLYLVFRVRTRK